MAEYFYLEPLGLGGAEIENIHSYLARLARLHGLTPFTFYTHLSRWWVRQGHGARLSRTLLHDTRGAICGIGNVMQEVQKALQLATACKAVERTTLCSLAPAISPRSGSPSRKGRAWCEACFLEDHERGRSCYDRLLWSLVGMERCPIHHLRLSHRCPTCGSDQQCYEREGDVTACWRCHGRLIKSRAHWQFERNPGFGEKQCVELIAAIGAGTLTLAKKNAVQDFVREVYRKLPTQKSLRYFAQTLSLKCQDSHILRHERYSLHSMLRIAQCSGVSLVDILGSPKEAAAQAGDLLGTKVKARQLKIKRLSPDERGAIESRLRAQLSTPSEHPFSPIRSLAKEMGVDVARISYHFPELHRQYMARRTRWIASYGSRTQRLLAKELRRLLREYPAGKCKTTKQLETALMSACGVGRKVARHAVARGINSARVRRAASLAGISSRRLAAASAAQST